MALPGINNKHLVGMVALGTVLELLKYIQECDEELGSGTHTYTLTWQREAAA